MKKDTLKSSLIKKKPIIEEKEAQAVVQKVHEPPSVKDKEEETVKTSVDFRVSLYQAMKIKLVQERMSMREYLEGLIEADMGK
mgnify:CR=1 FL=1